METLGSGEEEMEGKWHGRDWGGEGAQCVERILPAPWEGVWFVS